MNILNDLSKQTKLNLTQQMPESTIIYENMEGRRH